MQASDPLLRDTSRRRAGHASLRRLPRPQSLASALDFLGRRKLARQLSLGSLRERVVQGVQRRYLAHELLLLAFYQRRSPAVWIDPLARWRSLWRTFGTAVLLLNALLFTSAAWVHWRCEATAAPPHPPQLTAATLHLTCPPVLFGLVKAPVVPRPLLSRRHQVDPLCDVSRRPCPHYTGIVPARQVLPTLQQCLAGTLPERGHGCRRELGALVSGMAVQSFSLAELINTN